MSNNDESSPAIELSASNTGAEVGSTSAVKAGVVDDRVNKVQYTIHRKSHSSTTAKGCKGQS
jgi:hypothetical protein